MKFVFWMALLSVTCFSKPANSNTSQDKGKDEIVRLVDDEFSKETSNVRSEWERVSKKLSEIQARREKAVEESKARGLWEAQGAELLQKFQTVINSRYHGANGEFEGGLELSQRDTENINKVFNRYLSANPLKVRVSTGEAVRFLEWGIKRLTSLSNSHNDPTEANNSELEILAYQNKIALSEQARMAEIGKMVGLELNGTGRATPKKSTRPAVKLSDSDSEPSEAPAKSVGSLLPPVAEPQEQTEEAEAPPVRKPASKKKRSNSLLPEF